MEDDLFISKKELVSTIERLLYNISRNSNIIASGGSIDYTPILQQIEQDLNTPNGAVPITEFNTGDYSTQPLLTQQYQNTQLLKSILACIGQATNFSPTGLTIMGAIETWIQYEYNSVLKNVGAFTVDNITPFGILIDFAREVIIDNRGSVPVYASDSMVFSYVDGLKIHAGERLVLKNLRTTAGNLYFLTETGTTSITVHLIQP